MPVSPRDFELYSRMTGAPMPMDAQQRMQMAPEVFQFSKNFAKKPNILEKTGNLVKNIGKTVGMGLAVAAAAPAYVEQQETPADNQGQKDVENQTASNTLMRSGIQTVEVKNNKTIAKDVTEEQNFKPAFKGYVSGDEIPDKPNEPGLSTGGLTSLPSGMTPQSEVKGKFYTDKKGNQVPLGYEVDYSHPVFRDNDVLPTSDAYEFDEIFKPTVGIGGSDFTVGKTKDVSSKVDKFLSQSKLDPVLLSAMQNRGQEEELVGTSFPIASQLTDNPQIALDGGQSTRAQSREFIKETEPIDGGIPTNVDPSTLTPEVKNILDTLAKGVSNMPIEQRIKVAKEMVEEKNMMDSPNEAVGKLTAEINKKEKANQNLLDFVKTLGGEPSKEQKIEADQANSRILQKTAAKNRKKGNVNEKFYPTDVARTDIQVGGMKDRKTGLGRSVGISYTPLNGDTKVGFNMMSDPTKPKDVKTYDFTASPEAMQSLQSQEEGELGSETFGKLFNIAKKKQQGFSGMET